MRVTGNIETTGELARILGTFDPRTRVVLEIREDSQLKMLSTLEIRVPEAPWVKFIALTNDAGRAKDATVG